jgi:hypothetical protein
MDPDDQSADDCAAGNAELLETIESRYEVLWRGGEPASQIAA